jgi:hypothetical protein
VANTASSGQRSKFWCPTAIRTRPWVSTGDHDYPQFHARSRTDRARPICVYGRILPCPSLAAAPSSSISTAALHPARCAHWPGSHHPRSARGRSRFKALPLSAASSEAPCCVRPAFTTTVISSCKPQNHVSGPREKLNGCSESDSGVWPEIAGRYQDPHAACMSPFGHVPLAAGGR